MKGFVELLDGSEELILIRIEHIVYIKQGDKSCSILLRGDKSINIKMEYSDILDRLAKDL